MWSCPRADLALEAVTDADTLGADPDAHQGRRPPRDHSLLSVPQAAVTFDGPRTAARGRGGAGGPPRRHRGSFLALSVSGRGRRGGAKSTIRYRVLSRAGHRPLAPDPAAGRAGRHRRLDAVPQRRDLARMTRPACGAAATGSSPGPASDRRPILSADGTGLADVPERGLAASGRR